MERMYKIDREIVFDLIAEIVEKEFNEKLGGLKMNAQIGTQYNGITNDEELIEDIFSMYMDFDGEDGLGRGAKNGIFILNMPLIYANVSEFQEDIYWFLNMEYGFDLYNWGLQHGFTFEESVIAFCLCHEVGHMKSFIEDFNEYGYYKTYEEDIMPSRALNSIFNEEELFISYRRLNDEYKADINSIEFLKIYGDFIKELIDKGMLIECTTEEVDDILDDYYSRKTILG